MTRDYLDEAIDITAARMTAVTNDDALARRIANALPERAGRVSRTWIARFATASLAALILAVVLRTFDEGSTAVLRTEVASAPAPATRIFVEPPSNLRRTIVEPALNARRTIVEPTLKPRRTTGDDFERSLAAIDAPAELTIDELAASALASEAPLEIEPLVVADLPLTAEFSPR